MRAVILRSALILAAASGSGGLRSAWPDELPEHIEADTPRTTVAGNTFVAPAGWSLLVRGPATVLEAPAGSGLAAGQPVIVNPYISCGSCVACRKGKPNCCVAIKVLGVHTDGAFCDEIAVPATNLYPAGNLSLEAAATVEFLAIGAHAVRRAQTPKGSRSLVIGAGPIGLGTALFSRIAGHDVTLLDTSAERLAMARDRLGFDRGVVADANVASALAEITDAEGFDVVFDATGYARSMEAAFAYVAHGGTLVYVSVVKDDIRFADPEFHKREMTLVGSRNATAEDFRHVVASIEAGHVPVEALVTHRTTLEAVPADLAGHQIVGYVSDLIYAAELRYLDEILPGLTPTLASSSIRAQGEMIRADGGIGVMHCFMAEGLVRVLPEVLLERQLWLSTYAEVHDTARMRVVRNWLRQLAQDYRGRLAPY